MQIKSYFDLLSSTGFIWILVIPSVIAFLLMGADKILAIVGARRIPEKYLIGFALAFGSLGGLIGMYAFRHKTRKVIFKLGLPIIFIVQVMVIIAFLKFLL